MTLTNSGDKKEPELRGLELDLERRRRADY
jgi:hypothetical protein